MKSFAEAIGNLSQGVGPLPWGHDLAASLQQLPNAREVHGFRWRPSTSGQLLDAKPESEGPLIVRQREPDEILEQSNWVLVPAFASVDEHHAVDLHLHFGSAGLEAAMLDLVRNQIDDTPLPPEEAVDAEFEEQDQLNAAVKSVTAALGLEPQGDVDRDAFWSMGDTRLRLHWSGRPTVWIHRA